MLKIPITQSRRLVGLENTHNGRAVPISRCQAVTKAARTAGLSVHLDGARFFNAIEALSCSETELANLFDTILCVCQKGWVRLLDQF